MKNILSLIFNKESTYNFFLANKTLTSDGSQNYVGPFKNENLNDNTRVITNSRIFGMSQPHLVRRLYKG